MEADTNSDGSYIECRGVGDPVFRQSDTHQVFYSAVAFKDMCIHVGDCVRVRLEQGVMDEAFGHVLALFLDEAEEMFAEVQWFLSKRELNSKLLRLFNSEMPLENEFLLSDQLDNIEVVSRNWLQAMLDGSSNSYCEQGSIVETIRVQGYKNPSDQQQESENILLSMSPSISSTSESFICRFMITRESKSLHAVNIARALHDSRQFSEYAVAYAAVTFPSFDVVDETHLDPYTQAIRRLHISVVPDRLPCRTKEQERVTTFITRGIQGEPGSMLISGMPGSGKTATVLAVVRMLQNQAKSGDIGEFEYVEINCLRIRKAEDAYSILWHAISGEVLSGSSALKNLTSHFNVDNFNAAKMIKAKAPVSTPVVCLLDEMEFLITKSQTAIYHFLDWSMAKPTGLILIGVANAMDVVDRLLGSNSSRTNVKATQMAFSSYTFNDITDILSDRIANLSIPGVDHKTVEACARRAATFTGDVRTALKIFQRALELLREDSLSAAAASEAVAPASASTASASEALTPPPPKISDFSKLIALVKRASEAYANKPFISMLQHTCCKLDQAVMIVVCKNIKVTGGDATLSVATAWNRLRDLLEWAELDPPRYENYSFPLPPLEVFYDSITRLLEIGLLAEAFSSNQGKSWTISDNILLYSGASLYTNERSRVRLDRMIGSRLEFGDILGALRDFNPLVQYVA